MKDPTYLQHNQFSRYQQSIQYKIDNNKKLRSVNDCLDGCWVSSMLKAFESRNFSKGCPVFLLARWETMHSRPWLRCAAFKNGSKQSMINSVAVLQLKTQQAARGFRDACLLFSLQFCLSVSLMGQNSSRFLRL